MGSMWLSFRSCEPEKMAPTGAFMEAFAVWGMLFSLLFVATLPVVDTFPLKYNRYGYNVLSFLCLFPLFCSFLWFRYGKFFDLRRDMHVYFSVILFAVVGCVFAFICVSFFINMDDLAVSWRDGCTLIYGLPSVVLLCTMIFLIIPVFLNLFFTKNFFIPFLMGVLFFVISTVLFYSLVCGILGDYCPHFWKPHFLISTSFVSFNIDVSPKPVSLFDRLIVLGGNNGLVPFLLFFFPFFALPLIQRLRVRMLRGMQRGNDN